MVNNLPDEGKQIIMSTFVQFGQNSSIVGNEFKKNDNDYKALENIVKAKSEKYPARYNAELNALKKMVNNK